AYLAERANALHVYIVAPRETRIEAAMKRLGVSRKEAEKAVDTTDAGRRRYVKEHYGRVWDDASGYDLIVNTGRFTYAQAAEVIVEAAVRRGLASR
ncbi:MAG: cytidylate kinase-like family protein, partial [Gemmatimonadota bacterium]|nr:cytidylate kinase-like family protein [Gemmatimonadota bacterium]